MIPEQNFTMEIDGECAEVPNDTIDDHDLTYLHQRYQLDWGATISCHSY